MFNREPKCPGNREDYILINSKEGKHWRRKRGTVKPATLNRAFQSANDLIKVLSPIAAKIVTSLSPYVIGFKTGRLNIRILACLRKSLNETNHLHLAYLKGLQFQKEYPLERMVLRHVLQTNNKNITIEIDIGKDYIIPQNNVATDYYFEAILSYGDITKEGILKTKSVVSPLYSFNSNTNGKSYLSLPLPDENDWMLLLKINCLEGDSLASHTKHYRMKVVAAKPQSLKGSFEHTNKEQGTDEL